MQHAFLRSRRSIRRFRPEPVADEIVRRILETATYAPSAHNRQPWRFVVIDDTRLREQFVDAMGAAFLHDLLADGLPPEEAEARLQRSRERILSAPIAILLCLDMSDMDRYPDPIRAQKEYMMAVQSVALCGGQLLLAAHAEGVGGVWMCAPLFANEAVKSSLSLPPTWEAQALILLGYPQDDPTCPPRKPLDEVTLFLEEFSV